MAATSRDHEPPAVLATVAALLGPIAFVMGLLVPQTETGQHIAIGAAFGIAAILCGWRVLTIARRRRAVRTWAWVGLVLGALSLPMLVWQFLAMTSGGAIPAPFWLPYAGS